MSATPMDFAAELARLLQAEPELFGELRIEDQVLSGALAHEHPMAWRCLPELEAVEALTLVSPSPAEREALPHWRDPGWTISTQDLAPGAEPLTLWWHAATQQAMLASLFPLAELRHDAVARTLHLHREGLGLCRWRAREAAPPGHPHPPSQAAP